MVGFDFPAMMSELGASHGLTVTVLGCHRAFLNRPKDETERSLLIPQVRPTD